MRRDCTCPCARHTHGTWHAYANDLCRCQPCRDAWAAYSRRARKHREHYRAGRPLRASINGTALRLRALAVVGWSNTDIAARLGTTPFVVWGWQHARGQWITPESAARVAALYDAVWDQPPPGRYAVKIRRHAARMGWLPPMGLDDDLIDQPDYRPVMPTGGAWDPKPCGTPAAARRHHRRGEPLCRACTAAEARRVRHARPSRAKRAAA